MTLLFLGAIPSIALFFAHLGRPGIPAIDPSLDLPGDILKPDWENSVDLSAVWQGLDWQVAQLDDDEAARLVVVRSDRRPWADLLLYWVPEGRKFRPTPEPLDPGGHLAEGRQLPAESLFLGALNGNSRSVFKLPPQAIGQPGMLTIYSLPYRRVAAVSKVLTLH